MIYQGFSRGIPGSQPADGKGSKREQSDLAEHLDHIGQLPDACQDATELV